MAGGGQPLGQTKTYTIILDVVDEQEKGLHAN